MDELLRALQLNDPVAVNKYAMWLLVTRDGRLNRNQVNEFERYAPCKISEWHSTTFKSACYIGTITYNNRTYGFG